MIIDLSASASADIVQGYLFYEERCPGLGDYFEASILADINSLLIHAGVHEVHYGRYYRKVANKFP